MLDRYLRPYNCVQNTFEKKFKKSFTRKRTLIIYSGKGINSLAKQILEINKEIAHRGLAELRENNIYIYIYIYIV